MPAYPGLRQPRPDQGRSHRQYPRGHTTMHRGQGGAGHALGPSRPGSCKSPCNPDAPLAHCERPQSGQDFSIFRLGNRPPTRESYHCGQRRPASHPCQRPITSKSPKAHSYRYSARPASARTSLSKPRNRGPSKDKRGVKPTRVTPKSACDTPISAPARPLTHGRRALRIPRLTTAVIAPLPRCLRRRR